ncbi:MAG TPA: phosphatase PAP2 family protein [Planctomycetes bacterium]|nr:phosphatase PAP2 family protein [Planctomycetota bacterium]
MQKLRRNRCRFYILFVILVFLPACTTGRKDSHLTEKQTICQNSSPAKTVPSTTNTDPNKADVLDSLWKDVWTLPDTIIEESKEIIAAGNNLTYLLMAGGASIAMHNTKADHEIADNFDLNRALGKEVDEIVSNVGGPGVHFAATGLWYAISVDRGDELNKQRSWTMMKALSVTGAATMALKLIVNNHTPNDKWLAWPSGHTASSFTVASVLDELYGPEVGFPAYLAAGFVGYRMMDSGDHWASDVVFGAVLGWIVGHHIGAEQKALELAGFEVNPYTTFTPTGPAMGLSLVKRF